MFGYYYVSEETKALRFLRDNDIRFSDEVESDLEINPGQTITITFSILSLLINRIEKLESEIDERFSRHLELYDHNRSSYY